MAAQRPPTSGDTILNARQKTLVLCEFEAALGHGPAMFRLVLTPTKIALVFSPNGTDFGEPALKVCTC